VCVNKPGDRRCSINDYLLTYLQSTLLDNNMHAADNQSLINQSFIIPRGSTGHYNETEQIRKLSINKKTAERKVNI